MTVGQTDTTPRVDYRIAASLARLRDEVNERFPGRDKSSDGWIGDANHPPTSDHKPWVKDDRGIGVVRALDIDSGHGTDTSVGRFVAEHLVTLARSGHPALGRGAYVISDRRIASATNGWKWSGYSGSNPHISHTHVSVSLDQAGYDSLHSWELADALPTRPTIRKGSTGEPVRELQQVLNKWYPKLPPLAEDGVFGVTTEDRVKYFQRHSGITEDGIVGPLVWRRLGFK